MFTPARPPMARCRAISQRRVCGRVFDFRVGETIHTENSYKFTVEAFGALARGSGWTPVASWTDPKGYFSVQAMVAADR